jgi:hypothetical protein
MTAPELHNCVRESLVQIRSYGGRGCEFILRGEKEKVYGIGGKSTTSLAGSGVDESVMM